MRGCRSSRPVPAARREERVSNKHFAPRTLSGLLAGTVKEWGSWLKRVWQALGSLFLLPNKGSGFRVCVGDCRV